MTRRRLLYIALALATIAVGLAERRLGTALRPATRDALGDALWAVMMSWWIGALAPGARLATRSLVAYAVCAAVEVSQLYHAPWLDATRATSLGHLVLGSGFDSRDLAAYAVGVGCAAVVEMMAARVLANRRAAALR